MEKDRSLIMAPDKVVRTAIAHPVVERGRRRQRPQAHVVHLEEDISDHRRGLLFIVAAIVFAFTVWASTQPVAETAVTSGQVVPVDPVLKIQHFEGGIVREVLVQEGDHVSMGQLLLRLDPAAFEAEQGQLLTRRAFLEFQLGRLRAFAAGEDVDLSSLSGGNFASIGEDQQAILAAQIRSLKDRRSVLQSRLGQRKAEEAGLVQQLQSSAKEVSALSQERDVYRRLFQQGIGSKISMLRAERELAGRQAEQSRMQGQLESVRGSIAEVTQQLMELESSGHEETVNRIGAVAAELAEVEEALGRARDKVNRLTVTAPSDGVIKGLAVRHAGEVVTPGQLLAEIVPGAGEMVVESRIATKDIGAVEVGQTVRVKVTAFDYARYGSIDGTLELISATTFFDEQGQPYYKARIRLSQNWIGKIHNRLLPGMVVQADILTGEKTLIEYLLKPIYVAATQAFTER